MEGAAARPSLVLAEPALARADVDGDRREDAVVLLAESSGGSGTFQHLAVLGRRGGQVVSLATAPIGDRVQVRAARVAQRRITLDVVQQGGDDPAAAPAHKAVRTWTYASGGLVEGPPVPAGIVSIRDLEGVEWVLDQLTRDDPAPDEPAVTLEFVDGRVLGSGFCNRFFAQVTEPSPTELAIGEVVSTRRGCPPGLGPLESRFLDGLRHVRQYRFLAGRLALVSGGDGTLTTMLFTPRSGAAEPPAPPAGPLSAYTTKVSAIGAMREVGAGARPKVTPLRW